MGLLPHQHHRAKGTVVADASHIARVRSAQKRERTKLVERSPKESLYVNMPHSPTSTSIRFDIEVLVLSPMFFACLSG